jgi:competence ComEA-like helix-hairpin-helix protein
MNRNRLLRMGFLAAMVMVLGAGILLAQTSEKTQAPAGKQQILKGKTVNLNKVTAEDLLKNVPLITPELAKKIVQYRKDNGDFQSLQELLQVDGFTRGLFERIKKFFILDGIGGKDCTC